MHNDLYVVSIRGLLVLCFAISLAYYKSSPTSSFARDPWFMPIIFILIWITYREK